MNWLLEQKLKKLAARSAPDRSFVHALDKTLRTQTGHPGWWVQGWKYALAGVSIVSVGFSATGVYAYTSDDVLPDNPLYSVRQGIENVQVAMAATPEQKTTVQLKLLRRRLHEQELIAARQNPIPPGKLLKFNVNLQNVFNEAADLSTSTQEKVDEDVADLEQQHEDALVKERDAAKTTEQKNRIEDILTKQRDNIQQLINSLQASRKARFTKLLQNRLNGLHDRLDRINKKIDGLSDSSDGQD